MFRKMAINFVLIGIGLEPRLALITWQMYPTSCLVGLPLTTILLGARSPDCKGSNHLQYVLDFFPAQYLLHYPSLPGRKYQKSLATHMVNAARMCIPHTGINPRFHLWKNGLQDWTESWKWRNRFTLHKINSQTLLQLGLAGFISSLPRLASL